MVSIIQRVLKKEQTWKEFRPHWRRRSLAHWIVEMFTRLPFGVQVWTGDQQPVAWVYKGSRALMGAFQT